MERLFFAFKTYSAVVELEKKNPLVRLPPGQFICKRSICIFAGSGALTAPLALCCTKQKGETCKFDAKCSQILWPPCEIC